LNGTNTHTTTTTANSHGSNEHIRKYVILFINFDLIDLF
jgi:hypothetical protein